jgi:type IV secretion system protein VirB10
MQPVESAPIMPVRELDAMTRSLSAGLPGGGDDQNMQEEKRSFAKETKEQSPYLLAALQQPISKYEIKAGTIIPSLLLTGLNSDLPGQIAAQVRENVYDTATGRYLLIPQGTRLVGEYDSKVAYGQDRALIVWSRLILPNGNSINLEGMPGVDMSGYSGLSDRVNNHYAKLVTGVLLGSVLGAGAQVATGGQGTAINAPSFSQLAVSGGAQNLNQAGQQITQRNLNLQPTIEIRPGLKLNVFVTKDMILKPYRM